MQLYSARRFAPLERQLEIIASNGYAHVESFGAWHDDPAASARLFGAYGLTARSAHIPLNMVLNETLRAVDIAQTIGAEIAVAPYLPEEARPSDASGWRRIGAALEKASDIAAPQGVRIAWHNHDFEFHPLHDGSLPIAHLLGERLLWEADLAWIVRAGADPALWISRYADRIAVVHVKDIAPAGEKVDEDGWADVGTGVLPWTDLWRRCAAAGVELFVAEHDNPASFERFARVSAEAMRGFQRGDA